MQRPIPTSTLIRFPTIFGSFMIACGVAFYHRKSWLDDGEEFQQTVVTEAEGARMIGNIKQKHKDHMQSN